MNNPVVLITGALTGIGRAAAAAFAKKGAKVWLLPVGVMRPARRLLADVGVDELSLRPALETVKSGIRVNSVAPGPIDTGMLTRFTHTPENKAALVTTVPMERLGLSEEVANAIVFIASDEASFITGHVLNVDGGKTH
jgi:NAD(P)-dependent dehydrogenase (short-subunit alcohol dehydrogenase family)